MTYTEKKTFLDLPKQIEQVQDKLEQAEMEGAYMETVALCEDLCELKHRYLTLCISSMSSGTIAGIIGNEKYLQIDRAVNKTLVYLNRLYYDNEPELVGIGIDTDSIISLVKRCYKDNTL